MNLIDLDTFTQGSPLHLLCLAICLVFTVITALLGRRERRSDCFSSRLRHFIVVGSLLSWVLSNGYGLHPSRFNWSESLPLHFCNLANLIGALAVATRIRRAQSLMYFWTFGLSIWAFLTPSLYEGPASVWFWLFWLYHVFILIAATWILIADGFRPTWSDFRNSLSSTFLYMSLLAILDFFTGWNYGFVGPSLPSQANLLDFLGPYPTRLVWMALIGTAIFTLLMIPWIRRDTSISKRSKLPLS